MSAFAEPARVLAAAVAAGAFPAAVAEVGRRDRVLWTGPFGHLSTEPDAAETTLESVFDLASLTKVVTTTTLAMRAVDDGGLALDSPLREHFRAWQTADRREVTVRDLLEHASGLTPHLPFFRDHHSRAEYEEAICRLPLEYEPRQRSHYSDLGFILLGFLVADTLGAALDTLFERLVGANAWGDIAYRPPSDWRPRTAPTEVGPLARAACSSVKCMMRTPGRWAASPVTRVCLARRRRSVASPASCSADWPAIALSRRSRRCGRS